MTTIVIENGPATGEIWKHLTLMGAAYGFARGILRFE
jgi:hypothetical protein